VGGDEAWRLLKCVGWVLRVYYSTNSGYCWEGLVKRDDGELIEG
jgi:hypothetical protein